MSNTQKKRNTTSSVIHSFPFRSAFDFLSQSLSLSLNLDMDSRLFIALSLCFLSCSVNRLPALLLDKNKGASVRRIDPTRVAQLSRNPRAFIYRVFLSAEECDHLINLAKDKLEKSMVADDVTGKDVLSQERTSSGMFLFRAQDEIVADIESRIAAWTFLPIENGESIQILRYENGQKYEPHFDFFRDPVNQLQGGHRVATVLMYLSNVEKGGETVFPDSQVELSEHEKHNLSNCAKNGYAVKPKKGDALLFFSLHPNTTLDTSSLHGSCPVIEGEKWSATKWIHVQAFGRPVRNSGCVDEHEKCPVWAREGECEKNPYYMVGSNDTLGYCRKSCDVCSPTS